MNLDDVTRMRRYSQFQLTVVNFSGIIYTAFAIASIAILNVYYTCPALYSTSDCAIISVLALVIVVELIVNLALFHSFNKRNQVSYWTVKSSSFFSDSEFVESAPAPSTAYSRIGGDDTRINHSPPSPAFPAATTTIVYGSFPTPTTRLERTSAAVAEGVPISDVEENAKHSHESRRGDDGQALPPSLRSVSQQPTRESFWRSGGTSRSASTLNNYQFSSEGVRLYASSDGIYRRESTLLSDLNADADNDSTSRFIPNTSGSKFCGECNRLTPKRCHHCTVCRICVLRKDHHCFVSGGCVGLANQRFFIVFLFWATIGGALGTYLLFAYLNAQIAPLLPLNWLFYIGPVAVMRAIFGYETLFNAFLAVVSSLAFASTFGAAAFLGAQIFYTLNGYTMYDYNVARLRDNLDSDGETLGERLALVFGRRWWLNFVVPQFWLPNQMTPAIARNIFLTNSKDL